MAEEYQENCTADPIPTAMRLVGLLEELLKAEIRQCGFATWRQGTS
jgi:hypothetical protein